MFPLYTTGLLSKIRISRSNYKFKSIPWPDDTVVCIFMEVKAYEADCWCDAIMGRRKRQHLDAARIYGRSASSPGDPYHISIYRGRAGTGPACMPVHMKSGERFFCSEDLALKWRNSMPFSEKGYPRIVFAPMSKWEGIGIPDVVYVFADPDQISALVIMLGSHNGEALNTLAPFGAACHSIVYAVDQIVKEKPMAIMGLFDISQRREALANSLSLTMPYSLWEGLSDDLDKSCLTTHAWKEIEKRL